MNTQKKILTLLFICLLAAVLSSAQERYIDAVYLKNGSIIRGMITENVFNQYVKIESAGNIYVYQYSEIEKTERVDMEKKPEKKDYKFVERGFSNEFAFAFNLGDQLSASVTNTVLYTLNYKYMFGAGTGIEGFEGSKFIPIFSEARFKFIKDKFSPYGYLRGGYDVPAGDNGRYDDGGVLFECGIGYFNHYVSGNAFIFSLGFRYQENKYSGYSQWYGGNFSGKDFYRRMVMKASYNFH